MRTRLPRSGLVLLLCSLVWLGGCSGKSRGFAVLPASDDLPQPDNLSWGSRAAIDAYIRFSSWRGERSGYIVLFARDGVPVYGNAAGWKDIGKGEPMSVDTHVRIASMTKPVTAVAAMILVEEGRLDLDDPVAKYLPEFADPRVATSETPGADGDFPTRPAARPLLVRHLLMFSSGIGPGMGEDSALVRYWEDNGIHEQGKGDLAARVARLAELPLFEEPGTRWRYGYSIDVLAVIVEKASGQRIAGFMRERIFEPLGMQNTRYVPPPDQRAQLATVDNMRRLHVPDGVLAAEGIEGLGWGLGMAVVADADASVSPDREGDFWWAGYFGTTFFVSPSTGLVGVIMTQNKPGEFSGTPYQVYVVQGLAFAGL